MKYWLWLRSVKGVGPATAKNLLTRFKGPQAVYQASAKELLTVPGIGPATAKNLISARSLEKAAKLLNNCRENEISLLTIDDPRYPDIAKTAKLAPILLFYKGRIPGNFYGVAIVGSRRCSQYAKEATLKTSAFLSQNGIAVISGLAKGIDSYAHVACIRNGGYTIAFAGCGLDISYPAEHSELMAAIAESGAVISEYPPGTPARAEHFPARNRLISSWSNKVLVIEAAEKSGALITADFARQEAREVFVLPGETAKAMAKGSQELVEKEGAKIFCDPDQVLPKIKWQRVFASGSGQGSQARPKTRRRARLENTTKALSPQDGLRQPVPVNRSKRSNPPILELALRKSQDFTGLSPNEILILTSISQRPKTIENISFESGIPQGELLRILPIMEIEGKIQSLPGARYQSDI